MNGPLNCGEGKVAPKERESTMPEPRTTLVTAAQLARIVNLTPNRISQMRYSENCPFVETHAGDRYDLETFMPWYLARRGGSAATVKAEPTPADQVNEEAMS